MPLRAYTTLLGFRQLRWRYWNRGGAQGMACHAASSHEGSKSSGLEDWPHPIYASDRLRDRKSVFLAHASVLSNSSDISFFLEHLTRLPTLKRATHCMYAYRTSSASKIIITGKNDGGEGGSGDRLARLLENSGGENVVVVVSRWYGGVKLGSDRWKRISDVAKQALNKGDFLKGGKKNANYIRTYDKNNK